MTLRWNEDKRKRELFKDVLGSEIGQDILTVLAKDYHVYKTTQTPDPYIAAYQEGQRSVVLKIMEYVHTDLETLRRRYELQEQERIKRRQ